MITATLLLSLAPAAPGPVQEETPPLDLAGIQSRIDRSLHWLRAQQDAETGGYGNVLETLAVLEVFTRSHRAYRPEDGPFIAGAVDFIVEHQRADGAIAK